MGENHETGNQNVDASGCTVNYNSFVCPEALLVHNSSLDSSYSWCSGTSRLDATVNSQQSIITIWLESV